MNFEDIHNNYLATLNSFINGKGISKLDLFISTFLPRYSFKNNAGKALQEMNKIRLQLSNNAVLEKRIKLKPYEGKNIYVHKMMQYLKRHLNNDIMGAYVHGSLGTYEDMPYSDFDALVILKDEVFESSKRLSLVAFKLYSAQSFMFKFDPIQHHGWIALTESDLRCYPEHYFPLDILKYAKSLCLDKGIDLRISAYYSPEITRKTFQKIGDTLINQVKQRMYPVNIYQLKSLFSQFMLLPSLYCQICSGKGIFKKLSFAEAKKDFLEEEWAIMDEVSEIREKWEYKISNLRKCLISSNSIVSRLLSKKYSPKIPESIRKNLNEEFYQKFLHLVLEMQKRIRFNILN